MNDTEHPRDFIGYGQHPPDPQWPGDARLAINFVLNYEEGSELSFPEGDGVSERLLTEVQGAPSKWRDLGAESMFEYGSRVGFWRIHRLFTERNLPLTVFGCAMALERNLEAAAAIGEAGWDVCSHGWRWVNHYQLDEPTEREHIRLAVESIERTCGERPYGWYCRYAPSLNTRRLLVEEGGFPYDSDAYNDELPYWTTVGETSHLVIPYSLVNNDLKTPNDIVTSDAWFSFVRDAIDLLYREGASTPKMMSVGLHQRLIGHPARAAGLERLLDYVGQYDDIWVTRRVDIARHWIETHPYE
ncbi:MAG: allantoinase PuuE [Gammaproteobacteria bacterium]|nr:allantoinase PuuE [Gammaproteobacteria bacterium]